MTSFMAISSGLIAVIVAFIALDIFVVVFGLSFLRAARAQRAVAEGGTVAVAKPVASMSRRDDQLHPWHAIDGPFHVADILVALGSPSHLSALAGAASSSPKH